MLKLIALNIVYALFISHAAILSYKLGVEMRTERRKKWYQDINLLGMAGYTFIILVIFFNPCGEYENEVCRYWDKGNTIKAVMATIWLITTLSFSYFYGKYKKPNDLNQDI